MTKIIVTSDLHLGNTSSSSIAAMICGISKLNPDAVIVAGDLGGSLATFQSCLQLFEALQCPVGVLAGNHDLWTGDGRGRGIGGRESDLKVTGESADLFFNHLPAAVRTAGMVWLEEDSILLPKGLAVCGSIAWYDYSRRRPATANWTDAQFAAAKPRRNNDGNFIHWGYTDPQFAKHVCDGLLDRLTDLQNTSSVRNIAVVTHVPVFVEQLVSAANDDPVMDAYFANLTLGEQLRRITKITTVISGHTHREVASRKIARSDGQPISVSTIGSDYGAPKFQIFFC